MKERGVEKNVLSLNINLIFHKMAINELRGGRGGGRKFYLRIPHESLAFFGELYVISRRHESREARP